MRDPIPELPNTGFVCATLYRVVLWLHEQFYCRFSLSRFLWLAPKDKQQNNKNEKNCQITFVKDWLTDKRGRGAALLTFISTDSLSFSRLIILMATFLPITQCTPNLTSPATGECKRVSISFSTYIYIYIVTIAYPSGPCPGSSRGDRGPQIGSSLPSHCSPFASCGRLAPPRSPFLFLAGCVCVFWL